MGTLPVYVPNGMIFWNGLTCCTSCLPEAFNFDNSFGISSTYKPLSTHVEVIKQRTTVLANIIIFFYQNHPFQLNTPLVVRI